MWFLSVASAATDPYTALRVADPPGLCLSAVPTAGKLKKPSAAAFDAARTTLWGSAADPAAVSRWWTTFEPGLAGVPPHPALDGVRASARWLGGDHEPGPLLALADAWPGDPCLAASAAAAAFAAGDVERARSYAGRAWIPWPTADVAQVLAEVALGEGERDRATNLVDKGLALEPEHPGLRRLRARLTLESGGSAADDLQFLRGRGDGSLDPVVMRAHFEENRTDDYLRLAVKVSPPLGLVPGLADAESPMAALRAALGVDGPGDPLRIVLDTSEGAIPCTLFVDDAPYTVAMFVGFATGAQEWTDPRTGKKGEGALYTDVAFHRVIPQFMIQGGDPLGTGTGGPGYQFHDETRPNVRFDRPGRLAMANAGPGTNGSQFFVTEAPTPHLDGKHTIFGQCEALELVSTIANVPRDGSDRPRTPVVLRSVRVLE